MELLCGLRVQREIELIFPAELKSGLRQRVVPDLCAGVAFGQVGGMSGDFVGDHTRFHIFTIGEAEVLFRRHVTEHRAAVPADHGRTDAGCNVVIAWRDVGRQRPERIEGRLLAFLELFFHVHLDHMHRYVAGSFDHDLHVMLPGDLGQFAQRFQLGELAFVVGIGDGAWPQPVAQAE